VDAALYTRVNPHTGWRSRMTDVGDPADPERGQHVLLDHAEPAGAAGEAPGEALRGLAGEEVRLAGEAKVAWDGQAEKKDDLGAGEVELYSTWHMTQQWKGGQAKRLRDQVQFLGEFPARLLCADGQVRAPGTGLPAAGSTRRTGGRPTT